MAKLDILLDLIKNGMKQSPPAVHGQIPKGFTLDSYREAVQLGLFDNGAPPEEVLEMMRQYGTVGKMDGLQYHDGTSDIDRMRSGINERVGEMNKLNEPDFLVRKHIQHDPSNMADGIDIGATRSRPSTLLTDVMKDLDGLGHLDNTDWPKY
jgi:hypothetical protein